MANMRVRNRDRGRSYRDPGDLNYGYRDYGYDYGRLDGGYETDDYLGYGYEEMDRRRPAGLMATIRARPWLAAGVGAALAFAAVRTLRAGTDRRAGPATRRRAATRHGTYIAWLNDAYAAEKSLAQVLRQQAKAAEGHPELQARLEEHRAQTERHAELVRGCIERQGGHVSTVKGGMGAVMGRVQGMSTGLARDELVKNALAGYASEHLEIASYKALIAAAEELGDAETAGVCRQILRDEEEMARWLDGQVPTVTKEFLREQHQRGRRLMPTLPTGARGDRRYFKEHFETHFAKSGERFQNYQDAYRYGAELAQEAPYRDRLWEEIEPDARRRWEREHGEPWDSRREAVRYGYNRGTLHTDEQRDIELGR